MEQEHKRRVRYAGTHPRIPGKIQGTQPGKVPGRRGENPAKRKNPCRDPHSHSGRRNPESLQIHPGQTGYDATLGYGGHTRRMLEQLQGQGHLYATDVDPVESEKTRAPLGSTGLRPRDPDHPPHEFCQT